MTEDELTAIEQRANAATPGPWTTTNVYDGMAGVDDANGRLIVFFGPDSKTGEFYHDWPEAEFIAHARTDIPALIAEVRRLREIEAFLRIDRDEAQRGYKKASARAGNATSRAESAERHASRLRERAEAAEARVRELEAAIARAVTITIPHDETRVYGCEHARLVGQPCPHCMQMGKQ